MPTKNSDPRRRCMRLWEWPVRDQAMWGGAISSAGPLDNPGSAAYWSEKTRNTTISAYGRYLTFLALQGWLDSEARVQDRVPIEWLRAYIDELMVQVELPTVAGRIRGLAEALRVMAPGVDFPDVKRARNRLKAMAVPTRDKRSKIVSSERLVQLGLKLINEAETGTFSREAGRACTYRDGLMILLLACRPLRRANFAIMQIGVHLTKLNDAYQLTYDETETKGQRHYSSVVSREITPFIDRYLERYRPVLLKDLKSDRVWIAMGGHEMAEGSLYQIVTKRTKDEFGWSLSPHLFRHCAVTSLGAENPELVWVGMSLLHHTDPRTTEKHYDQALSDKAVNDYQEVIRDKRRGLTSKRPKRQSKPLSKRSA